MSDVFSLRCYLHSIYLYLYILQYAIADILGRRAHYKITGGGGGGGGHKSILHGPNLTLIFCNGSQHLVSCSVLVVNLYYQN